MEVYQDDQLPVALLFKKENLSVVNSRETEDHYLVNVSGSLLIQRYEP